METNGHRNIEQDVVEDILSTLSPKSLMRFKCVSKRWYVLITSPRFVAKHLSICKHKNFSGPCVLLKRFSNPGVLLERFGRNKYNYNDSEEVFSLLKFRNNNDHGNANDNADANANDNDNDDLLSGIEDIDIPPSLSLIAGDSSLHIIGHCHGIICLVAAISREVILWNPAIHEFKPLPPQPYLPDSAEIREDPNEDLPEHFNWHMHMHGSYMDGMGFGYDPRSNDYKVVSIGYPDKESPVGYFINLPVKAVVYSMSSNSWREMESFSLETESTILLPDKFQMYFKGMCFWTGRERHKVIDWFADMEENTIRSIIVVFDMSDEVFHEILIPESPDEPFFFCQTYCLQVWNESVALVGLQDSRTTSMESAGIWLMDEFHGPKSPWTKHISVVVTGMPLAFLGDDEILLQDIKTVKDARIYLYNLSTNKLKYLPIQNVQIDSTSVVYDNYSIVSILGGNKIEDKDKATNAGFILSEHSRLPSSIVGNKFHSYSVWAMPPANVSLRIKKVMEGLRSEFGGPEFEPHITVVGSVLMTHADVLDKFSSLQSTSGFKAKVNQVESKRFYYQCVSLVFDNYEYGTGKEISQTISRYGSCFGFLIGVKPYLSILYGNLTEEQRRKAQEKVSILDESLPSMSFPITRLALYKIDYKDKTLKSWEKIAEHTID